MNIYICMYGLRILASCSRRRCALRPRAGPSTATLGWPGDGDLVRPLLTSSSSLGESQRCRVVAAGDFDPACAPVSSPIQSALALA